MIFKNNQFVKVLLAISILIASLTAAFYFIYWLPRQKSLEIETRIIKLERETKEETEALPTPTNIQPTVTKVDNTDKRKECFDQVEQERINITEQALAWLREENKDEPKYNANQILDDLEGMYDKKKQECYNIYK